MSLKKPLGLYSGKLKEIQSGDVLDSTVLDASSTLAYAATVNLDFSLDNVRTISLTGNITFTTSNKATTRQKVVRIIADSSSRTFSFPVGWVFIGNTAPTSIAANKTAILSLYCFGSNESDIVAAYAVQA